MNNKVVSFILAYLMQPSTIHGLSVLAGLAGYSFGNNPAWAAIAYAVVSVLMPQKTPVAQTDTVTVTPTVAVVS